MTSRSDSSAAIASYTIAKLDGRVDTELGRSPWLAVAQNRIDAFADATEDRQWIHVDPIRAANGPYGATVAHGYLLLSLLPALVSQTFRIDGIGTRINYGLNKVRFPAPVKTGARIRAVVTLTSLTPTRGGMQLGLRCALEIERQDKPGCVAETLALLLS